MSNRLIETVSVRLNLGDLTGSSTDGWISELKKTSDMWVEQNMPRLANIQVTLEEEPTSYAVVVYQDPVEQLSAALLKGEEPQVALAEWQRFAGSLLELHERFPDRMSLGLRPLSYVDLENLVDHVARSTGLPLETPTGTDPSMILIQNEGVESYGIRLAAMQLLELRAPKVLGERLQAASVETAEKPHRLDLVSEFLASRNKLLRDRSEYLKLRSASRDQKKELDRLKKESALLIPQLHRTQEELEDVLLEKQSLTAKVREMRKGRDYRKNKIQELEREVQDQAQKLEWLRSVRDQHRSSANELRVEQQKSQTDIRILEKQVETLSAELKSIKGSRSWRYTRILRQPNDPPSRA